MSRLQGKVALITGAARGQGRSHAVRMAEEGADIIVTDTTTPVKTMPYPLATADDLEETVRLIEKTGRRAIAGEADVRDLEAMSSFTDHAVQELGRLDVIVANAGVMSTAPTLEMSEQAWQDVIDVNLTGVWKTLRSTVPHIVRGGSGGSVIITSSLSAFYAHPNTAHYSASKAGLVMLMKVLAKELSPHSIRVNTVHPTTVNTAMVHNDATYRVFRPDLPKPGREDFEEALLTLNQLPTPALETEDVTGAVMYLASDEARYITGTTLVIDAGALL